MKVVVTIDLKKRTKKETAQRVADTVETVLHDEFSRRGCVTGWTSEVVE